MQVQLHHERRILLVRRILHRHAYILLTLVHVQVGIALVRVFDNRIEVVRQVSLLVTRNGHDRSRVTIEDKQGIDTIGICRRILIANDNYRILGNVDIHAGILQVTVRTSLHPADFAPWTICEHRIRITPNLRRIVVQGNIHFGLFDFVIHIDRHDCRIGIFTVIHPNNKFVLALGFVIQGILQCNDTCNGIDFERSSVATDSREDELVELRILVRIGRLDRIHHGALLGIFIHRERFLYDGRRFVHVVDIHRNNLLDRIGATGNQATIRDIHHVRNSHFDF